MSVEGKPASLGPWGGQSGHAWDDGMYTTVKQIIIAHGSGIDSIQIEYDKNGSSVWSEKRGGKGGKKFDKVKFDYPHEYLISVNGTYGSFDVWGTICVRSLTFESNRRKYGPFGVDSGTFFALPKSGSKIIGFHGKAGWYLDAIGVHTQPIPKENNPSSKILLHSHQSFSQGDKKHEYSVLQGSVGQNFDIVVTLRKKDPTLPSFESRDSAGAEVTKHKLVTDTEKSQSKIEGGAKTYGPWGGTGGIMFDDGIYTGIRQINLSRNVGIVSMKVCYDFRGQAVWGSKHGGVGGFKHDKIVFDYPSEVLTHVTGTYGPLMYMGPNVIKSLTFRTNRGKHGPYGEEQGPSFTHQMDEGKVVGFLGREGLFLDSIGVHVMECKISSLKPSSPHNAIVPHNNSGTAQIENSPWANKLVLAANGHGEEVDRGVVKEPTPSGPGPWGGDGGQAWDDGVFSGIKQIFVTRGNDAITSIQIEYDRNGQSVWSIKHGGDSNGVATHRIKFEYPDESITCISGYYGPLNNSDRYNVVKSLSFYTSRGRYGPYGEETGTFFTSTTTQGKPWRLRQRSMTIPDLCNDLVDEILCRVPARNLKRLRSTSKRWNRLFKDDRRFAREHMHKAPKEYLPLMLTSEYRICPVSINLQGDVPSVVLKRELSLPDPDYSHQFDIGRVFHCDGLLVCNHVGKNPRYGSKIVVWNPLTGQTRWIEAGYRWKEYEVRFVLGYCYQQDENNSCSKKIYKILCFYPNGQDTEIYELNYSDRWTRTIPDGDLTPGWTLIYSEQTVSMNGNLYLFASEKSKPHLGVSLLRFDFSTEKSSLCVTLPYQRPRYEILSISAVRGGENLSLLLQLDFESKTEIWVTNKIDDTTTKGAAVSWTKVLAFDLSPDLQLFSEEVNFLLDEDKKVAVCCERWLEPQEHHRYQCRREYKITDKIYILGEDNKVDEVGSGEGEATDSLEGISQVILNYAPSLVQIEQAGGGKTKRGDD